MPGRYGIHWLKRELSHTLIRLQRGQRLLWRLRYIDQWWHLVVLVLRLEFQIYVIRRRQYIASDISHQVRTILVACTMFLLRAKKI